MAEDGISSSSGLMITSTSSTGRVEAVALGSCHIVLVAVGGGGEGTRVEAMGGGGGSGFVTSASVTVNGSLALEV